MFQIFEKRRLLKNIDDLIRLLLNEKEIENFLYEIEHLGDSVDSRVLGLANLIGESIFTLPQMLKLLEQIKLRVLPPASKRNSRTKSS